jgi:dienelactone hydrolase
MYISHHPWSRRLITLGLAWAFAVLDAPPPACAATGQAITIGAGSPVPVGARYYVPDGSGPFPAVVVLHGVGGLWLHDNPAGNVMSTHFEEYAQLFAANGYASLFVDSYTARGLVEFSSRRPAEDPALDDAVCSPAYERPKDVFKALAFLQSRPEIDANRLGLLGFSQGAETSLASVLSPSINRATWTESFLKLDGTTVSKEVPAPPRIANPPATPVFKVAVVYYPGCGFYGYYGDPKSTRTNLYMPYAPVLIQHGGDDPLYSANLYPDLMVAKAGAHAAALGLGYNPMRIVVYPGATHSFDEANLLNLPPVESPNQTAKRLAREQALLWFNAFLKRPRLDITRGAGGITLAWPGGVGIGYDLLGRASIDGSETVVSSVLSLSTSPRTEADLGVSGSGMFIRLRAQLPAVH